MERTRKTSRRELERKRWLYQLQRLRRRVANTPEQLRELNEQLDRERCERMRNEAVVRMNAFLRDEQRLLEFRVTVDKHVRLDERTGRVTMTERRPQMLRKYEQLKNIFREYLTRERRALPDGRMPEAEYEANPVNRLAFEYMARAAIEYKRDRRRFYERYPGSRQCLHAVMRMCPRPVSLPALTPPTAAINVTRLHDQLKPRIGQLRDALHCDTCALELGLHELGLFRDRMPSASLVNLSFGEEEEEEETAGTPIDLSRTPLYATETLTANLLEMFLPNQRFRGLTVPSWLAPAAANTPRDDDDDDDEDPYMPGVGLGWLVNCVAEQLNNHESTILVEHLYVFWGSSRHVLAELLDHPDRYHVLPWTCLCSKGTHCNVTQPTRPSHESSWQPLLYALTRFLRIVADRLTLRFAAEMSADLRQVFSFVCSHCYTLTHEFTRQFGDRGFGPQGAAWDDELHSRARLAARAALRKAMIDGRLITRDLVTADDDLMTLERAELEHHARQIRSMRLRLGRLQAAVRELRAASPLDRKRLSAYHREATILTRRLQTERVKRRRLDRGFANRASSSRPMSVNYAKLRYRNALFRLIERQAGRAIRTLELEPFNMHRFHRHLIVVYRDREARARFHREFVHQQLQRTVVKDGAAAPTKMYGHSTINGEPTTRIVRHVGRQPNVVQETAVQPPTTLDSFARRYFCSASRSALSSPLPHQTFQHAEPSLYFATLRTCRGKRLTTVCKLLHAVAYMSRPSNNLYSDSETTGRNDYRSAMPRRGHASPCSFSLMRERLYGGAALPTYDPTGDLLSEDRRDARLLAETVIAWDLKLWEGGHFYIARPVSHHACSTAQLLHEGAFAEKIDTSQYQGLLQELRSTKREETRRLWTLRRRLDRSTGTEEQPRERDEAQDYVQRMARAHELDRALPTDDPHTNSLLTRRWPTARELLDLRVQGMNFEPSPGWSAEQRKRWAYSAITTRLRFIDAENRMLRYCALTRELDVAGATTNLRRLMELEVVALPFLRQHLHHRLLLLRGPWCIGRGGDDERQTRRLEDQEAIAHGGAAGIRRIWLDRSTMIEPGRRRPGADEFGYYESLLDLPIRLTPRTYDPSTIRRARARIAVVAEPTLIANLYDELLEKCTPPRPNAK